MDKYYKSEKFKSKLKGYEDFLESGSLGSLDTDDLCEIAQYFYELKESDKSLQAINVALELYPGSVGPLAFRARYALFVNNDPAKADEFAEAIDDKTDPDYVLLKAEIMIFGNRSDDADRYLEDVYSQTADYDEHDDMPLDVALLFADYEEWDLSAKWLKRSDEVEENDYKYVNAEILISKEQYDAGEKIINELLDNDPYSSDYWNVIIKAKFLSGNFEDCITACDYAIAINPDDSAAIFNKGNSMYNLGNYSGAAKQFANYIKLVPKKDIGYLMLGVTQIAQSRFQEAEQSLLKALKANLHDVAYSWQNRADTYYHLSYIEDVLGHYDLAHQYLDKLEDVYKIYLIDDCEQLSKSLADLDCAHGLLYLEQEDIGNAIDWFGQAIIDSNESNDIYIKIAASAFECGYVRYSYNILHGLVTESKKEIDPLGFEYLAKCCKILGLKEEESWALEKAKKSVENK